MRLCVTRSVLVLAVALVAVSLADLAGAQEKAKGAVISLQKGGEIRIEFFPDDAPKTVENFVKLASQGFYDGQLFHRVDPKFVVQTGDPQSKTLKPGDPKLGTGGPGYTIKAEFNKRPHERGVVSMARAQDPNSAGSQFFICVKDSTFLDGNYTAFGRVLRGIEVADKIVNSARDARDNPKDRVEMKVKVAG